MDASLRGHSGSPTTTRRAVYLERSWWHLMGMDERARALQAAMDAATDFFTGLPDRPVWPRAGLDEMLTAFGEPLSNAGQDAAAVVADIAGRADPGLVAIPGGRFFGFV
ncbi:MAG TPA: hypothetical protein VEP72_08340, partial [Microbacterium sp.]|nr:hypothetical protein [Microbacterium sp.]